MSAASAAVATSVPSLYRSLSGDLVEYLADHFQVTVHAETLSDLLGYLVAAGPGGARRSLVISDEATDAERLYVFVHTAAHLLLGHADRPFATIVEPRRTPRGSTIHFEEWQLRQDRDAAALTAAILWGCEEDARTAMLAGPSSTDPRSGETSGDQAALGTARSLSGLLPGHKYRALRRALVSGSTRKAILGGLRIARAAYHRTGARGVFANDRVVRELRQVYCLTELAAVQAM
jgi:hypothetical protein